VTLTLTDLFCGAGGSSQGAVQVPGVDLRLAANHWQLAVETHAANFPGADHDTANISQVDFRRYPATDLLWASPECTNHSQARGISKRAQDAQPDLFGEVLPDEAALRSRATMHDVPRALEVGILRGKPYAGFVVENVVEAKQWMYWRSWWSAITEDAGYCAHVVSLNSMHAQGGGLPAPQSRDRLYVVGHLRAIRCPDLAKWVAPRAWCPNCAAVVRARQSWKPGRAVGRYRAQYVYVCPTAGCHRPVEPGWLPAAAAIDWALPGERIGDRARPLAVKTLARIEAGLRRYAQPRRPFLTVQLGCPVDPRTVDLADSLPALLPTLGQFGMLVPAGGTWNESATSVADPMRARTTRDTEALVVPVEGRDGVSARPAEGPLRAQTARLQDALVVPLRANGHARPVADPLPTFAAGGTHHALLMRNNTARGDQGQMSTPTSEPMRTLLAEGGKQSLIRWDDRLYAYDTGDLAPVADPLATQTTVQGDALLGPAVRVEDCSFRMLEPHEIGAGMAFAADYRVLGNKRERVRQYGNAVTPPAARDLIAALVEAITGEDVERAS
jgi:DNA (cytosine-5)-methyltransferase 1